MGDRKSTAILLWVALLFIFSGLVIYLIFSTPPEPPRRSYPVLAKSQPLSTYKNQASKGDDRVDHSCQGH